MITTIARWGNSQGVRIPSDLMKAVGYAPGDEVDISTTEKGILIQKRTKQPVELKAGGMLKKYVKRHVSDREMNDAWKSAVEESWR